MKTHCVFRVKGLFKLMVLLSAVLSQQAYAEAVGTWDSVLAMKHRTPEFTERDQYRHPAEALTFLGVNPDHTVVEIWPGKGWWVEILAPYLKQEGTYYVAGFSTAESSPGWRKRMVAELSAKLEAHPEVYGNVNVTELGVPDRLEIAPANSADRVLTFRNVHNWMKGGYADDVFASMYAALKPGGVLGVVEHRAKPGTSIEQMNKSGYVTEAHVKKLAAVAGFEFESSSELNANPLDTADHPRGVWTLPPSLRLCESMESLKEEDRVAAVECWNKYRAIGESDRMTLRFRKPLK
jgi:predicted methyltransferase